MAGFQGLKTIGIAAERTALMQSKHVTRRVGLSMETIAATTVKQGLNSNPSPALRYLQEISKGSTMVSGLKRMSDPGTGSKIFKQTIDEAVLSLKQTNTKALRQELKTAVNKEIEALKANPGQYLKGMAKDAAAGVKKGFLIKPQEMNMLDFLLMDRTQSVATGKLMKAAFESNSITAQL